jgi:hypothetical protein
VSQFGRPILGAGPIVASTGAGIASATVAHFARNMVQAGVARDVIAKAMGLQASHLSSLLTGFGAARTSSIRPGAAALIRSARVSQFGRPILGAGPIVASIAQGSENLARADLSYIERAHFARNMVQAGVARDPPPAVGDLVAAGLAGLRADQGGTALPLLADLLDEGVERTELIIAQGSENLARADLSYIERAHFARNMVQAGVPG